MLSQIKNKLKSAWDFFDISTRKFNHDHLSAYAAQATFYLLLSFFPFLMLVCMMSRLLPFKEESLLAAARTVLPPSYRDVVVDLIDGYYNDNIESTKVFLIIFLIWTASRLIHALMNGFNMAYGIEEKRSQTLLRLIGCLYTLLLCALMLVVLLIYVLGAEIVSLLQKHFGMQVFLKMCISIGRNLAGPLLMLLIFWLAYAILPSRKIQFRDELPGAFFTAVFWRLAIELLTYIMPRSITQYSYVYGSLANLIIILVWLYTCVYFWFVGAELNRWLKKRKERKAVLKKEKANKQQ